MRCRLNVELPSVSILECHISSLLFQEIHGGYHPLRLYSHNVSQRRRAKTAPLTSGAGIKFSYNPSSGSLQSSTRTDSELFGRSFEFAEVVLHQAERWQSYYYHTRLAKTSWVRGWRLHRQECQFIERYDDGGDASRCHLEPAQAVGIVAPAPITT